MANSNKASDLRLMIPQPVVRKLGHYVYLYVNPIDNCVFYVGKGRGARALAHLHKHEGKTAALIKRIRAAGKEPRIDILAHGLPNADTALRVVASYNSAGVMPKR